MHGFMHTFISFIRHTYIKFSDILKRFFFQIDFVSLISLYACLDLIYI